MIVNLLFYLFVRIYQKYSNYLVTSRRLLHSTISDECITPKLLILLRENTSDFIPSLLIWNRKVPLVFSPIQYIPSNNLNFNHFSTHRQRMQTVATSAISDSSGLKESKPSNTAMPHTSPSNPIEKDRIRQNLFPSYRK